MHFDLDQIYETIYPAAFSVKIDQIDYPVRALALAEVVRLDQIAAQNSASGAASTDNEQWYREFVPGLFAKDVPPVVSDLRRWDELSDDQKKRSSRVANLVIETLMIAYIEQESAEKKFIEKRESRSREMIANQLQAQLDSSGSDSSLH